MNPLSLGQLLIPQMQAKQLPYRFIVLDGVEGCGKSTQVELLARCLRQMGEPVVVTYEPGGTATGEAIRSILLDSSLQMSALTEAFLFCASRAQHMEEVIEPALEAAKIVVCDRFSSATAAYQSYAGGLDLALFKQLDDIATGARQPDMTIILDLEPAKGRKRKQPATQPDRIERKDSAYHRRVRAGFLEYARQLGSRAAVVSADGPPQQIHQAILEVLGIDSQAGRSEHK